MHNNIYIEFKKKLDQSYLMNNFLKHRFLINLKQSAGNSSEYPVGNKINRDKLLIKAKKEIEENCKHEFDEELEKEIIDKKYISELDELNNQVNKYATIIENQK